MSKKIWVSSDGVDSNATLVDLWSEKPNKKKGVYENYKAHLNTLFFYDSVHIFGRIEAGQCKCFEIKEVKE